MGEGGSGETEDAEREEDGSPAVLRADEAAGDAAEEAAEDGARDVDAHDAGDERGGPLLRDVRDGDDEDAWSDEALEQAPEGEGEEAGRGGRKGCADGEHDHGGDDKTLAVRALCEESQECGGDGDA